jgi:hypothetical protein
MPLPPTGPISFAEINIELGRNSTDQIGINEAEAGTYGAINTISSARPDGSTPNSINEWRGYNHYAVALTLYQGAGRGNSPESACNDTVNVRNFYSNCGPFELGGGCTIYVDTFPNPLIGYEYVVLEGSTYTLYSGNGQISGFSPEQC